MTQTTVTENLPKVRIQDIIIDEDTQVRLDLFVGIEELAADMKENGQLQAIELRQESDGLHLVDGRRRIEAAKRNGWKELAYVKSDLSFKETILHTISTNMQHKSWSPIEEAKALKVAMTAGWDIGTLARRQGKTVDYMKERLSLLEKLDPKVQELLHEGKIGMETVRKAVLPVPKAVQANVAKEIVRDRLDVRDAQEYANRAIEEYEELEQFKKAIEETQFKTCPTCKKAPVEFYSEYGQRTKEYVTCRSEQYTAKARDHTWNLKTGKTLQQVKEEEAATATAKSPRSKEKKEKRVQYSFRYEVPVSVIRQAILNKAVAEAIKRLKKGAKRHLEVDVDENFRLEVRNWIDSDTLQFDLDDVDMGDATFEPKKYGDKHGNLTKISPMHTSNNQKTIDAENERFRKWLNSLPEIAEYRRQHKPKS